MAQAGGAKVMMATCSSKVFICFQSPIDFLQAEVEEIAAAAEGGGAKAKAALRSPRALELDALIARHKQHIVRLEQARCRHSHTCSNPVLSPGVTCPHCPPQAAQCAPGADETGKRFRGSF